MEADPNALPSWLGERLIALFEELDDVSTILRMAIHGAFATIGFSDELATMYPAGLSPLLATAFRVDAQFLFERAVRETERGFPTAYAQAVRSLWDVLESGVRDLVAEILSYDARAMEVRAVASIRTTVGEYAAMDKEERREFIVHQLEEGVRAKRGVDRFDGLLEYFGLGGGVDEATKRTIFELQNVRNVLVHRLGVVDRRLLTSCPWLKLKLGERLQVSPAGYEEYAIAVSRYLSSVQGRLLARYGSHVEDTELEEERAANVTLDATDTAPGPISAEGPEGRPSPALDRGAYL